MGWLGSQSKTYMTKIQQLNDLIGCLNESGITSQNYKQEIFMDKQIKKVKKDLKKGEKDTNKLMQMDKAFDKKLEKCDSKMKKK